MSRAEPVGLPRLPTMLGGAGCAAALVGYLLEWIRQRGSCELGDPSPDTLALSIALIVLGGGVLGLAGLVVAAVRAVRRDRRPHRLGVVLSVASLTLAGTLFAFANSGPGGWFQYCGS